MHNTVVAGPSGTIATKSASHFGLPVAHGVQNTLVAGPSGTIATSKTASVPVAPVLVSTPAVSVPLVQSSVVVPVNQGLYGQYISGYGQNVYLNNAYSSYSPYYSYY